MKANDNFFQGFIIGSVAMIFLIASVAWFISEPEPEKAEILKELGSGVFHAETQKPTTGYTDATTFTDETLLDWEPFPIRLDVQGRVICAPHGHGYIE